MRKMSTVIVATVIEFRSFNRITKNELQKKNCKIKGNIPQEGLYPSQIL